MSETGAYPERGIPSSSGRNEDDWRDGSVTTEWPEDRLDRIRLERIEQELAQITKQLEIKTRKLEAAERQIADLKGLIEVRKVPVGKGVPQICEYYRD